ncbi:hypothetical protein HU200_026299 [Digitaria exilis]|uniref:SUN domain-containing protein n=1 Tax=Digitaria exilis TaxID=1010633 RepID=A0A835BWH1_9POAL|nr:hypothetical protein HU200_026299 [Digitaria exilis]
MQRSRKARRTAAAAAAAAEQEQRAGAEAAANGRKRRLYGFSASLVVASWVAVLLLHSLVGHGDGQRDGGGSAVALTVVDPSLNEGSINPVAQGEHGENLAVPGDTCVNTDENVVLSEETLIQADQMCSNDEVQNENTEALTKDSQAELSEDQGQSRPQTDGGSGVQPGMKVESEDLPRPSRLPRVVPPGLDEFKTRAIAERDPGVSKNWETLGRFTVPNAKHAQNFTFPEPKWARYLKLNLLSHYGSEFYCTLSMLEVYGMDAVEKMLEDLIPVENKKNEPEDKAKEPVEKTPLTEPTGGKESAQEPLDEDEFELADDKPNGDSPKNGANDQISETRMLQAGRIPGDTVLKANEIEGILSWKQVVSSQVNQLILDNALLRSEFETFRQKQTDMENRSLAVIFLSFVFACLALAKLSIGLMSKFCRFYDFEKFHNVRSGWVVLLLSSCIMASILIIQ